MSQEFVNDMRQQCNQLQLWMGQCAASGSSTQAWVAPGAAEEEQWPVQRQPSRCQPRHRVPHGLDEKGVSQSRGSLSGSRREGVAEPNGDLVDVQVRFDDCSDNLNPNANAARDPHRAVRPLPPGARRRGVEQELGAHSELPWARRRDGADGGTDAGAGCGAAAAVESLNLPPALKRRRIRGKQAVPNYDYLGDVGRTDSAEDPRKFNAEHEASAWGEEAIPPNSVHGAERAGPSRSDTSTVHRGAPLRDRDGPALPAAGIARASDMGGCVIWQRGATDVAKAADHGRPPDAADRLGGHRGAS